MARRFDNVLRYLRRSAGTIDAGSDQDLLRRYAAEGSEEAFNGLIQRHGPMVYSVCRRALGNAADADDAFQATFLVLARRAAEIQVRSLEGWLYGVAVRVSIRARASAERRRVYEGQAMKTSGDAPASTPELRFIMDEEIERLPDKYREPVVLCYLQGMTQEEASEKLGLPRSSVTRWLIQARDLLRDRLARRGVAVPALTLIAQLTQESQAAVPVSLMESTLRGAVLAARGQAIAGAVSSAAAELADAVGRTFFLARLRTAAGMAMAALLAVGGTGLLAHQLRPQPTSTSPPAQIRFAAAYMPFETYPATCTFSANGKLATLCDNGVIVLGEARSGRELARIKSAKGAATALSPDATLLAVVQGDARIRLYDAENGKLRKEWPGPSKTGFLLFSPDGGQLACTDDDMSRVRILDVGTGREKICLKGEAVLRAGAFFPDALKFVTSDKDKRVVVWDAVSGLPLNEFVTTQSVGRLAISPNGRHIVAAAESVYHWDLDTGKANTLSAQNTQVERVTFHGNDYCLAAGYRDLHVVVRVWRLDGDPPADLTHDTEACEQLLDFSPCGQWMATSSMSDNVLRLHDCSAMLKALTSGQR